MYFISYFGANIKYNKSILFDMTVNEFVENSNTVCQTKMLGKSIPLKLRTIFPKKKK